MHRRIIEQCLDLLHQVGGSVDPGLRLIRQRPSQPLLDESDPILEISGHRLDRLAVVVALLQCKVLCSTNVLSGAIRRSISIAADVSIRRRSVVA